MEDHQNELNKSLIKHNYEPQKCTSLFEQCSFLYASTKHQHCVSQIFKEWMFKPVGSVKKGVIQIFMFPMGTEMAVIMTI